MNDTMIVGMGLRLLFKPEQGTVGVYEVYFDANDEPVAWASDPVRIEFEDDGEYMESCMTDLRDYTEAVTGAFTMETYVVREDEDGNEYLEMM